MPRSVYSVTDPGATSRFNPFSLVTKFAAIAVLASSVLLGTATLASAAAPVLSPHATTVSAGVVYVSWTGDGTATSYSVTTVPTSAGCTVSVPSSSATAGCSISGLTDGTSYVFTVSVVAPSTDTTAAETVTYIPVLPIANVVAYQAGASTAAVTFTADGVGTLYTVTNNKDSTTCTVGNSSVAPTGTQTCNVTLTSPNTDSPYIFKVTPNSGDTASTFGVSGSTVISTANTAAAPTTKVTAPGVVALTWSANAVATQYVVADAVGDSCTVGNGTVAPVGLQTCSISGLSQTSNYVFTVTGLGGGSTTTWAPTSSAAYPYALATPVATNAGSGMVTVTFTADGAATLYTVSAGSGNGTACLVGNSSSAPTGTQSCTVTGLNVASPYTFTVTPNDNSTPGTVNFTTASAMPTPTSPSAGNGSVTLAFTGLGNATTYVVTTYLHAAPQTLLTNTCTQVVAVTSTAPISCTVTGLTPGTAYDFVVTPSGGTTTLVGSAKAGPFTAGGPSSTPVVTSAGPDKLLVTWMANGTATVYTVSDGSVSCQVINTTTPPTGTQSCVLTDAAKDGTLVASTTITVTPNTGTTYTSVTVTAAAGTTYSRALAAPTVVNAGSGAVTATFTADGHAALYTVASANTVSATNSTCQVYNYTTAPTGTQSCKVTGLTNGVYYTFTVNPASTSYSTVSAASVALLVGANFAATPTAVWAGDGAATVSFTSDGIAATYVVTATDTTTPANGSQSCTVSNSTTPPAKGAQSCKVTGLTDGDSYTFSVTPSGNTTTLTMSLPSAAFVASASVAPFAPTGVTATTTTNSVTVTWVAPTITGGSAITGYVVTVSAGNTTTSCGTVAATATTCTITGLKVGTAYAISVLAVNAIGNSAVATATATTASAAALSITGLSTFAKAGMTRAITISGTGFTAQVSITSSVAGVSFRVMGVNGNAVRVQFTVAKGVKAGWGRLFLTNGDGRRTSKPFQHK